MQLPFRSSSSANVAAPSRHKTSLLNAKPKFESEDGSIQMVNVDTLPILKNLSIKRLILKPRAIREPHWHANANELAFCIRGSAMVSILDHGNVFSTFTLEKGEMYLVKNGSLHFIENTADDEVELIIAFRHEKPVDFSFGNSLASFTPAVLGNTYDHDSSVWQKLRPKNTKLNREIIHRASDGPVVVPDLARRPNTFKYNNEAMVGPVNIPDVGSAKTSRSQFWPALENMSMYNLRVEDKGMREPHWHPFTGELGYVQAGEARMTIMDPDGSVDTYTLHPGDVYFVPAAYPHHIECLHQDEPIHFLIFFDQPMPQDVGFRTSATLIGPDVMAATLSTTANELPKFPGTFADPLIVTRKNPID